VATYRGILADSHLDSLTVQTFEGYHRPRLEEDGQGRVFLAAEAPGAGVVGFVRAGANRSVSPTGDPLPEGFAAAWASELYAIYVGPRWLGRGVGRALFHAATASLREIGYPSMCVWVLTANARACGFYQRMGGSAGVHAPLTLAGATYDQTSYTWAKISEAVEASA